MHSGGELFDRGGRWRTPLEYTPPPPYMALQSHILSQTGQTVTEGRLEYPPLTDASTTAGDRDDRHVASAQRLMLSNNNADIIIADWASIVVAIIYTTALLGARGSADQAHSVCDDALAHDGDEIRFTVQRS